MKIRRLGWLLLAVLLLAGCAHGRLDGEGQVLYQVSTIDALLEGAYDGQMSFANLARHGGFGLGTFQGLDGEMVALEGKFYQVKTDGKAYPVDPAMTTPFANVTYFQPEMSLELKQATDFAGLEAAISRALPSPNLFYAVRIDGTLPYVKARSVPAQSKPYPKLVEAAKKQAVFEFNQVTGTLLGFYSPPFVKGVNVPGYHFHFLDQERVRGGHVLTARLSAGQRVQIMSLPRFYLALPQEGQFLHSDLKADRSGELHQVEKGR